MSIEFSSPSAVALTVVAQSRVLSEVENNTHYQIIRHVGNEFGLWMIQEGTTPPQRELVTVIFHSNTIYVAFHAASELQREWFLQKLQAALAGEGVDSQFDEL
jgi:hypothetical protein